MADGVTAGASRRRTLGGRIGVFGGTFDPPHYGHLAAALEVRHLLRLDRMLLVVANDPWQKSEVAPVTPAADRLALTVAAAGGIGGLEVSEMEIRRGGPSCSAETLEALRDRCGAPDLFMVVGSDASSGLDTWKRAADIRNLATTVVVNRSGRHSGRPPSGWDHLVVDAPSLEISSADLRARFADGRPVAALTPRPVIDGVLLRGLYGSGR